MAQRAPTESNVESLQKLIARSWKDGYETTYKSLTLRKLDWMHRNHCEFAVLVNDVLITVIDFAEVLKDADGDDELAAKRLAVKLNEIDELQPQNADEWQNHWETVRERSELIA